MFSLQQPRHTSTLLIGYAQTVNPVKSPSDLLAWSTPTSGAIWRTSGIGIDTYDQGWMNSVTDPLARFNQFSLPGLQAAVQFAAAHGKQFAVCEWGVGENGDNLVFVQQMAAFLASCPAPVVYHGYYDVADFDLQNSPQAVAAFITAFGRG